MEEQRQLRSATSSAASRARKSNLNKESDIQQRERKRALDRKAQRASREKTKSHIAHLEQTIQILTEKNSNEATNHLLEEVARLQGEIERLRKIIDGIKALLGVDIEEAFAPKRTAQSTYHEQNFPRQGTPEQCSKLCEIHSPSPEPHTYKAALRRGSEETEVEAEVNDQDINQIFMSAHDDSAPEPVLQPKHKPTAMTTVNLDFMELSNEEEQQTSHLQKMQKITHPSANLLEPCVPDFVPCTIWQKANSIYAKIFQYDRQRASLADTLHSGALIKIVKDGWDALSFEERTNPVLQILKEVDRHLFWDLDPVTKVANLYKSFLLLKYYFNAGMHNLEKMPEWQRPVASQRLRKHPIPIDFFPWPALRDRLVHHHNYYFGTSDFSTHYRQHFKFNWPFGFEKTYLYDQKSQAYMISPLFEHYHRDMRHWTMNKVFFQKFPEFRGEMTVFETGSLHPSSIAVTCSSKPERRPSFDNEAADQVFEAERMMELFNDFPPT